MRPGTYDLDLYRGDSYAWEFHLWDDAAKTEATDLSAVTVRAQIRASADAASATELNVAVTLPNIVSVALPAAAWDTITAPCSAVWDLELTYDGGEVLTVIAGTVTITADVTREVLV